ncbi:MAG: type III PLP-dependent enzyme [Chloroflexi bacterium]|nr:type III PLP-dependent enzyme [Chloroflexota bacterium]
MNNVLSDSVVSDPLTPTPALVIDFDQIVSAYNRFQHAMPEGLIYYAMKANANPEVVRVIVGAGSGLEIASAPELDLALRLGLSGERIICSNPIKSPAFIKRMHEAGVYAMVVDSTYETEKVAHHAPGSRVYVRLAVDNTGSVLPLAGKFGVDRDQALHLIDLARELGLRPIGLTFHVGSQCLAPQNWVNAIKASSEIWRKTHGRGHDLYFLDIGGGFPVGHHHTASIPTIETIGALVNQAIEEHMPEAPAMLVLEPGRGLVGEAGLLVTEVIGKASRGTDTWLYLDAGVFNGLMETYEGFPPVVRVVGNASNGHRPPNLVTLAGPTCDSCDVIARHVMLPEVHIGDRLVFLDAGAYTNEYASNFNGFSIPELIAVGHGASIPQIELV